MNRSKKLRRRVMMATTLVWAVGVAACEYCCFFQARTPDLANWWSDPDVGTLFFLLFYGPPLVGILLVALVVEFHLLKPPEGVEVPKVK